MPGAQSPLSSSPASEKEAKALAFIEEITKYADAVQIQVLADILSQNADTEYLQRFNLDGAADRETFKAKIPVVEYEDIKQLIERISDGDRSPVLSAHPITEFLSSSGTSGGEPKLIPAIEEDWQRRMLGYNLLMPIMNQETEHFSSIEPNQQPVHEGIGQRESTLLQVCEARDADSRWFSCTTSNNKLYRRRHSKIRSYDPYNIYTSPDEAVLCADFFQSVYAQILCGLYERQQVLRVGAAFATSLIRAIMFLQLNWKELTHDIRVGSLNQKIKDNSIRRCMSGVLRPDPVLADFIAEVCAKDSWEGILTRIWSNAKYLDTIVTGSMTHYIPTLDYYSAGLPIICTRYVSSECFIGVNLNPVCKPSQVSYTILPNMAYFEFLPIDPSSPGTLVDLADVEIGKEYELVVTTFSGLYRYRVGDILRVTGIYNSAPQFRFARRKNVVLSVDAEKTDEAELQFAINAAAKLLSNFNATVVEYTSYADTTRIPGHYVLYWELLTLDSSKAPTNEVLTQCCVAVEESLNEIYRVLRMCDNVIGPLEIRIVKKGTFEELMDFAIGRGASIGQYKVPKCVSFIPMRNLLDSRVESTHFSPYALPPKMEERNC